jgi:hypothetical protein
MISMSALKISTDRPTTIHPDGTMEWLVNDKRHREGKPAIVRTNGEKEYWAEGHMHRVDGPAYYGPYLVTRWYVRDTDVTEEVKEWLSITKYKWPLNEYQQMEFKMRFCCGE